MFAAPEKTDINSKVKYVIGIAIFVGILIAFVVKSSANERENKIYR